MNRKNARGFTLIELMIVVVILGILAAFAYPNYISHLKNARRADAKTALTTMANQLEKFFASCNQYPEIGSPANITTAWFVSCPFTPNTAGLGMSNISAESHYLITLDSSAGTCGTAGTCYQLTADPNGAGTSGAQNNDGKLYLDNTGLKQWDKDNSGAYGAGEGNWGKR